MTNMGAVVPDVIQPFMALESARTVVAVALMMVVVAVVCGGY